MTITEIYEEMKRRGLVRTKDEFSARWLCMHWAYFAVMGERTTSSCLLSLWENLQAVCETDLAMKVFALIREKARRTGKAKPQAKKTMVEVG